MRVIYEVWHGTGNLFRVRAMISFVEGKVVGFFKLRDDARAIAKLLNLGITNERE